MSAEENVPALKTTSELAQIIGELNKQLERIILKADDPVIRDILKTVRNLGDRIAGFFNYIKAVVKIRTKSIDTRFVVNYYYNNFSVISQNARASKKIIEYILNHLDFLNEHSDRIIDSLKVLYASLIAMQIDCREFFKLIHGRAMEFDFGISEEKTIDRFLPEEPLGLEESFRIMNISQKAGLEEVKHIFRKLVKKYHPDLNPNKDREEFLRIKKAYQRILSFLGVKGRV